MQTDFPWLRFNRQELAGAFGDIGTDLPLIIAMVATCHLDAACVCTMFGLSQIATGLRYGIPMPVQPLKAMAAIMLSQKLGPQVLAGGGLVVGGTMLLLAASGSLTWLAARMPEVVVRGIQLGLGMTLMKLAIGNYILASGWTGGLLAGLCALSLVAMRRQSRVPGPLVVVALGVAFAWVTSHQTSAPPTIFGWRLPQIEAPTLRDVWQGAVLLALPQLPLSLANSVIATSRATHDLFPQRAVSVRHIGFTYSLMNLLAPWWGGLPLCHGCGGLAGFHGFGARTGGAPVIYGVLFLGLGLFASPGFDAVVHLFPLPMLGVVLLFEALALAQMACRGTAGHPAWIAWTVAAAVVWLPHGYLAGLGLGCALAWVQKRLLPQESLQETAFKCPKAGPLG